MYGRRHSESQTEELWQRQPGWEPQQWCYSSSKIEIIQAASQADNTIVNVVACESWVQLKILVPYERYWGKEGLDNLREAIEAENGGVVKPPFSMKWMKLWHNYKEQWQRDNLPLGRASVIFKVPNQAAERGPLKEIWVAGNRFQAEIFVLSKVDSLCTICNKWGHSEFHCYSRKPVCGICTGEHRTSEHKCEVATCKAVVRMCEHTALKCSNCGEAHQVQDRRCRMKLAAIEIARWAGQWIATRPEAADWAEVEAEVAASENIPAESATAVNTADGNATDKSTTATNAATESDTEITASGTALPMTL
jgi:hypothetical protein